MNRGNLENSRALNGASAVTKILTIRTGRPFRFKENLRCLTTFRLLKY